MSPSRIISRRLHLSSASWLSRWQCSSRLHRIPFFPPGHGHVRPIFQNISTKSFEQSPDSVKSPEETPLPPLSVEQFRRAARDGRLDACQVRACLQTLRKEVERIPDFEKRRQRIVELKPGAHALLWALKLPREKSVKLSDDRDLVALVCYFVVAEGKEDYVLEWLRREAEQNRYSDLWAHHWISKLGQAFYDWEPTRSPTTILLLFQKARSIFAPYSTIGKSGFMTGLLVFIQRILEHEECPVYDATLFEHFALALLDFLVPAVAMQNVARLMLYHPTQPDAMPIYRAEFKNDSGEVWNAKLSNVNALGGHLMRAVYIFRLQSRHSEADELEALIQRKSSNAWRNRAKITRILDLDPKLDLLRWQALGPEVSTLPCT